MSCPQDSLQIFAQNVRRERNALSLSQEQLAEKAGLHRTFISHIERGTRNVSIRTMSLLAKALTVPLYQLLIPQEDQCE